MTSPSSIRDGNYLGRLLDRAAGTAAVVEPRPRSLFEPERTPALDDGATPPLRPGAEELEDPRAEASNGMPRARARSRRSPRTRSLDPDSDSASAAEGSLDRVPAPQPN